MNVKNVAKENGKASIQVEIDGVQFENALNKAYAKQKNKIAIPGFRKGKAPRKIVESLYGAQIFYEDAIDELFTELYTTAVADQNLNAVGQPSLSSIDKQEDGSMLVTLVTDLYPEVTLGEYKGLEIEKEEAAVSDAEVEAELNQMAEQSARISTVDRAAQNGDTVTIDFEGFVDGKAFDGGKGENYDLKLGSNQFIPGFEDQLVGIAAGESKAVVVTFPESYGAKELAGKEATFQCTVHAVKETILPEQDDEFAKDVSEFDTLDELKADIKAKKLAEEQTQIEDAFRNACVEKAAENMKAEIPESMIQAQLDNEMQNFGYQAESNGMSMKQYAEIFGGEDKLRNMFRPAAEKNVRSQVLLAEIAKTESIEISAEEVEEEYKKIADQYQMEVDKVKEVLSESNVRADLSSRKAMDIIAGSAVAIAPKAKEATETEE